MFVALRLIKQHEVLQVAPNPVSECKKKATIIFLTYIPFQILEGVVEAYWKLRKQIVCGQGS